jgi:hypothetical protein
MLLALVMRLNAQGCIVDDQEGTARLTLFHLALNAVLGGCIRAHLVSEAVKLFLEPVCPLTQFLGFGDAALFTAFLDFDEQVFNLSGQQDSLLLNLVILTRRNHVMRGFQALLTPLQASLQVMNQSLQQLKILSLTPLPEFSPGFPQKLPLNHLFVHFEATLSNV